MSELLAFDENFGDESWIGRDLSAESVSEELPASAGYEDYLTAV